MEYYICETCGAVFSKNVATVLNNVCPKPDKGKLIEIKANDQQVGHLIDKEYTKEVTEFDNRGDLWDANETT